VSGEAQLIGAVVGSYRVVARLGSGGMGTVYRAEHPTLGRAAAVKVLSAELSREREMVQRFFAEARATSQLRHPGIVDVFDFGYLADGTAWLLMELLEGEDLGARLKRGRLQPRQASDILGQAAAALGAAHARGILHRDIKPQNLFLVADAAAPGGVRVKVLDFGIAKLLPESGESLQETRTGTVMGTPPYMSPEQCRSARNLDARSDVYALGCVLYEMLTAERPFAATSTNEMIAAHLHVPPPPLRATRPELPAAIEKVVARALEKQRERRHATVEELARELERALAGGADTVVDRLTPRPAEARGRTRWIVIGSAGAALAGVALLAGVLIGRRGRAGRRSAPDAGVADLRWGFDPRRVEPLSLLPAVVRAANARHNATDFGVERVTARGVRSDGTLDLTGSGDSGVVYTLRSRERAGPDAGGACRTLVHLSATSGFDVQGLTGGARCDSAVIDARKCGTPTFLRRLLARGVAATALATVQVYFDGFYEKITWQGDVGTLRETVSDDDCLRSDSIRKLWTKNELVAAARKAGRPTIPPDFHPAAGDQVLATFWEGSWDPVVVTQVEGARFSLSYRDSRGAVSHAYPLDSLLPEPSAGDRTLPAAGAYLIARRPNGTWTYAQVARVAGDNVYVESISFSAGVEAREVQEEMVRPGEYVLIR